MTNNAAERCYLAYKKISTKGKSQPIPILFGTKLYFIVTTLKHTNKTYGPGDHMNRHKNEPLELGSIEKNPSYPCEYEYTFILKIYPKSEEIVDNDYYSYYYDYRDIIIEEKTKGMINFILSTDKPKNTIVSKEQTFKFDEKTLYNFKERKIL